MSDSRLRNELGVHYCVAFDEGDSAKAVDETRWALAQAAEGEASVLLQEAEPFEDGAYVSLESLRTVNSLFTFGELTSARLSLADALWGFINA